MPPQAAIAPAQTRKPIPKRQLSKLRHHTPSNQAYTKLDGRFIYFGRFDDPANLEKYHRTIAEWVGPDFGRGTASRCGSPFEVGKMRLRSIAC